MTTYSPAVGSWLDLPSDHPFGLQTLPYAVFTAPALRGRRIGVRIGDDVLDLTAATERLDPDRAGLFADGSLDPLLAAGRGTWHDVRSTVTDWLTDPARRREVEPLLVPLADATLLLPFTVADYVDFYSSEHHATNLGRILRPGEPPLPANWKHLPVGYHGRAGTVVVSGTPVHRPHGQRLTPERDVVFGPTERLDLEAEVGYVVGTPSRQGRSLRLGDASDHVFGVCLVNDWSARDIQAWEYRPLGPFGGKSFATSVSPWVVPMAALEHARVPPPARDVRLLPYLDDADAEPWGLDLRLEVRLNGTVISRPRAETLYWTVAQLVAHLTANGAALRSGDLLASGTVSGPGWGERGSLIELTLGGAEPVRLDDGAERLYLEDGDEVVITATAPGPDDSVVGCGEVRGRVVANP
jgi:fumarylacetoacetase